MGGEYDGGFCANNVWVECPQKGQMGHGCEGGESQTPKPNPVRSQALFQQNRLINSRI